MKRVGPKRVKVFEAGAGENPVGILGQALRAQEKRKGREFIASDLELREEATLRKRGIELSDAPKNLKMVRNCSMKELRKLPKDSQDIIFESYFLNNYAFAAKSNYAVDMRVIGYLLEAKRALKPRGRIVLVQNIWRADFYSKLGQVVGLKPSTIKLTQKQLESSPAHWVKRRSSPQKRSDMLKMDSHNDPEFSREVSRYVKEHKLKDPSDIYWPCMIVLRK